MRSGRLGLGQRLEQLGEPIGVGAGGGAAAPWPGRRRGGSAPRRTASAGSRAHWRRRPAGRSCRARSRTRPPGAAVAAMLSQHAEAVERRHLDVEEQQIGCVTHGSPRPPRPRWRRPTRSSASGSCLEQPHQPPAAERLVIGYHDAHRSCGGARQPRVICRCSGVWASWHSQERHRHGDHRPAVGDVGRARRHGGLRRAGAAVRGCCGGPAPSAKPHRPGREPGTVIADHSIASMAPCAPGRE